MPRGSWSFLHEWVIYDYIMARFSEKTLRLKLRISEGKVQRREKWVTVIKLKPITGTKFPDIKSIKVKGSSSDVPAEIKFTTSLFDYHVKQSSKFKDFIEKKGFIIVLSHDYLPSGLMNYKIDVYEIDQVDFVSFCRENFVRLLNRQIRRHTETKVWIMYQGPNFNEKTKSIKPARDSGIWCPTENLSSFDLAMGDRVLFIKTRGASTQKVQKSFLKNTISQDWFLEEIFVGELLDTILSREEYCQIKKIDLNAKLWKKDEKRNGNWRWNRVFEFKHIKTIIKDIKMEYLYENKKTINFVKAVTEAFCYGKSREVSLQEYRDLLEFFV